MQPCYCPECGSSDMKVAGLVHTWECDSCRKAFTIFVVAEDIGSQTPALLFDAAERVKKALAFRRAGHTQGEGS